MRVLALCHELPPIGGGGGRVCHELAARVASAGHSVDIVTMGYGCLPSCERRDGTTIYRARCLRRRGDLSYTSEKAGYVASALYCLWRLGGVAQYDLIHAHFILPAGLIAFLATLRQRKPVVITCHGSDVPGYNPHHYKVEHLLSKPLSRRVLARSHVVVSPSEYLRRLLAASVLPPTARASVIPNGFDSSRFKVSTREPRILLVSRLIRRKGFQHFLQAVEAVPMRHEVNIVGDGPCRPELEALASRAATRVRFWGWLDNDSRELRQLYETSSMFVLPSLAENFPVALLEAMAAGLAIITSNAHGCAEVVGDAALLVPPGDPRAIREAVLRLTADDALVAELGRRARQRLEAEFDWAAVTERYLRAYELALTGHAGGPR